MLLVLVGLSMGVFVFGLVLLEYLVVGLFLLVMFESIFGCEVDFDVIFDVFIVLIYGWCDELCLLDDMYIFVVWF